MKATELYSYEGIFMVIAIVQNIHESIILVYMCSVEILTLVN